MAKKIWQTIGAYMLPRPNMTPHLGYSAKPERTQGVMAEVAKRLTKNETSV
jgi:hypothetical protein